MATTIAVANQKGGVGKTSICLHCAGVFAQAGQKILLIDMDQQGTLSSVFIDRIHELPASVADLLASEPTVRASDVIVSTKIPGIDLLPANLRLNDLDKRVAGDFDSQFYLREALQGLGGAYDMMLIDCPPFLSSATRMALVAAHGVIVPVEPHDWAAIGSKQMIAFIEQLKKRSNPHLALLGIVINKYMARRVIEQQYVQYLRKQYGDAVFRTELANHVQYVEAAQRRLPITYYMPQSEQANTFREFAQELLSYVQERIQH